MFLRLPKLIQTRSKINSLHAALPNWRPKPCISVWQCPYTNRTEPPQILSQVQREREREERKIVKQKRNHTGRRMEWGGGMSEEIHPQAPAQEGKDIIYITTITHRPHTRASKFQLRTNHTATEYESQHEPNPPSHTHQIPLLSHPIPSQPISVSASVSLLFSQPFFPSRTPLLQLFAIRSVSSSHPRPPPRPPPSLLATAAKCCTAPHSPQRPISQSPASANAIAAKEATPTVCLVCSICVLAEPIEIGETTKDWCTGIPCCASNTGRPPARLFSDPVTP
jgi:hypothetical protein